MMRLFPKQPESETGHASDAVHRPSADPWLNGRWPIGLALSAFLLSLIFPSSINLTAFFLGRQDRWLLLAGAVLLSLPWIRQGRQVLPVSRPWMPLAAAAFLIALCFVGHHWILAGYDMSRDEQMANFDAAVFAGGHLVQKIPVLWRDYADALNTEFMYPAVHRDAWISSYLPLNAALRALVGTVATPALTGPLLTAIGALALWGNVRRIWPQDNEAPLVALLLYICSGQVIVTGMTAYAMPAHLALNLVWLWLFLRRSWWADMAALAVGFVAVGLHQPLMHPMFAGPLLFLLLLERQWPRAAFYALGYAVIGAFWLWWPGWTWSLMQANASAAQPEGIDYFTRLTMTMLRGGFTGLADMAANLLRFAAWQHLLLIPLLLIGMKVARKDRLAAALACGIVLTTFVMAVTLPYQGHGFGYRYLHGLIGNGILLAVYGWKSLGDRQSAWRSLLLRSSMASAALMLPLQLWMAHAFYAPAADADAQIAAIDADYALVSRDQAPFAVDLVHNPPTLDARPIRLISEAVHADMAATLCRSHPSVALVGQAAFARMNAYYGYDPEHGAKTGDPLLASRLAAAGCRVEGRP